MKILAAVDGSPYTKRMLAYLAAHDEWLGPQHEYTLLHAVPAVPPRPAGLLEKETLKALMSLHIGLWGRPPRAVGCFSGAELGVALGRERVIHACLLQERLALGWAADIDRLAGFRAIVPSSWPDSWRCVGWGLGGADAEPVRVRERDGEQGV